MLSSKFEKFKENPQQNWKKNSIYPPNMGNFGILGPFRPSLEIKYPQKYLWPIK
jgi:hypothetical protein